MFKSYLATTLEAIYACILYVYQHVLMLRSLPEKVIASMCIHVGITLLFIRRMQAGTWMQDLHTFCN